jgi:DNA polymerase-3 subunit alpha
MQAMSDKNLQFIMGCELYVCPQDPSIKDKDRTLHHLVVLAKNLQGWKSLVNIVSESNKPENFYYKPRLNLDTLAQLNNGNLIAFSGHLGSHLSHCILQDINGATGCATVDEVKKFANPNWVKDTTEMAKRLQDIFGKDHFFLEVQLIDTLLPANKLLAMGLRYISKQTGIPLIATPDAHYAEKEDAVDQRVLLCNALHTTFREVEHKMTLGEDVGLGAFFKSRNYHIPSYEEMLNCGNTEEELENTIKIASMCESYSITDKPQLPRFICPNNIASEDYLNELVDIGWKERWPKIQKIITNTSHTEAEYKERLSYELEVLKEAGLSDYFLIVNDIINWARTQGQLCGPGRGSSSGSLVLYLLGVTQIDPIEYDLLFSRFYNNSRNISSHVSFPEYSFLKYISV